MSPEWATMIAAAWLATCLVPAAESAAGDRGEAVSVGRWAVVQEFPAAEAKQGATADAHHFYAVTNNQIAKYDRDTGRRVALSSGRAEHLNSGFFWQGKIYCAHSNFPHTPERSQILVLDPRSMQLTEYHDFGQSDGSLTWCVRRDGDWWCTFAFYGSQQGKTYLARFDDQWQELQRWRFPPKVIARLGQSSISGGVWWGDTLVATGHDARELYRLSLPERGDALSLRAIMPAPFTGQGIATDPLSDGLWGIDRGRKAVILARPEL